MESLKKIWKLVSTPSPKFALGSLLAVGFGTALVFSLLFHFGFMTATNSMEICISCHEMEGVYEEYKESIHYRNRTGIQATCADCHVPQGKYPVDYFNKFMAKARIGSKDIWNHLIGTYPTKADFEKARWHLAQNVIAEMRHNGSKECRHCHNFDNMKLDEQDKSAAKKHKKAMEKGDKSCIDCHTGIAHEEPKEPEDTEESSDGEAEDSEESSDDEAEGTEESSDDKE